MARRDPEDEGIAEAYVPIVPSQARKKYIAGLYSWKNGERTAELQLKSNRALFEIFKKGTVEPELKWWFEGFFKERYMLKRWELEWRWKEEYGKPVRFEVNVLNIGWEKMPLQILRMGFDDEDLIDEDFTLDDWVDLVVELEIKGNTDMIKTLKEANLYKLKYEQLLGNKPTVLDVDRAILTYGYKDYAEIDPPDEKKGTLQNVKDAWNDTKVNEAKEKVGKFISYINPQVEELYEEGKAQELYEESWFSMQNLDLPNYLQAVVDCAGTYNDPVDPDKALQMTRAVQAEFKNALDWGSANPIWSVVDKKDDEEDDAPSAAMATPLPELQALRQKQEAESTRSWRELYFACLKVIGVNNPNPNVELTVTHKVLNKENMFDVLGLAWGMHDVEGLDLKAACRNYGSTAYRRYGEKFSEYISDTDNAADNLAIALTGSLGRSNVEGVFVWEVSDDKYDYLEKLWYKPIGRVLTKYFDRPKYDSIQSKAKKAKKAKDQTERKNDIDPFEILKLDEKLLSTCSLEQLLREQSFVTRSPFKYTTKTIYEKIVEKNAENEDYLNVVDDISREAYDPMKCTFVEHVGEMKKLLLHRILYKKIHKGVKPGVILPHVYANNQIIVGDKKNISRITHSEKPGGCILLDNKGKTTYAAWVKIKTDVGVMLCTSNGVYRNNTGKTTEIITKKINAKYIRSTSTVNPSEVEEVLPLQAGDIIKEAEGYKEEADPFKKFRVESQRKDNLLSNGEEFLKANHLKRVHTAGGGNCLFHALAAMTDGNADDIRWRAGDELSKFVGGVSVGRIGTIEIPFIVPDNVTVNNEGVRKVNSFDEYKSRMAATETFADEYMIFAASKYLQTNIRVVVSNGFVQEYITDDNYETLTVYNIHMLHFEATTAAGTPAAGTPAPASAPVTPPPGTPAAGETTRKKRKRSPSRSPSSPLISNEDFERERANFLSYKKQIMQLSSQLSDSEDGELKEKLEKKLNELQTRMNTEYPTPVKIKKKLKRLNKEHDKQLRKLEKKHEKETEELERTHEKECEYLTRGHKRVEEATSAGEKKAILKEYPPEEAFLLRWMGGVPYAIDETDFGKRQTKEKEMMDARHDSEYNALIDEQGTEMLMLIQKKVYEKVASAASRAPSRVRSRTARKLFAGGGGASGGRGGASGGRGGPFGDGGGASKEQYIKLRF